MAVLHPIERVEVLGRSRLEPKIGPGLIWIA